VPYRITILTIFVHQRDCSTILVVRFVWKFEIELYTVVNTNIFLNYTPCSLINRKLRLYQTIHQTNSSDVPSSSFYITSYITTNTTTKPMLSIGWGC
jgi:hypothetical protein